MASFPPTRMFSMHTRSLLIAVSVSAFLFASCEGPVRSAPAVHGRVFEVTNPSSPRAAWDLVPLAGADVLVTWRKEVSVLVDSQFVCVRAIETSTAADGTFTAPAWELPERMKRPGTLRPTSHVVDPRFQDVSVGLSSAGFAATAEFVHIVRRASDSEAASAREYQLNLKGECGDSTRVSS